MCLVNESLNRVPAKILNSLHFVMYWRVEVEMKAKRQTKKLKSSPLLLPQNGVERTTLKVEMEAEGGVRFPEEVVRRTLVRDEVAATPAAEGILAIIGGIDVILLFSTTSGRRERY